MRSPNPWSPKKGIQRNPSGYNAYIKPKKRKIMFSPAEKVLASQKHKYKRKNKNWTPRKGIWNRKQYEKNQARLEQVRIQRKLTRIADYKDNLKELESSYHRGQNNNLWQAVIT